MQDNGARRPQAPSHQKLAEIEILTHDQASFVLRQRYKIGIRRAAVGLGGVAHVVAGAAQRFGDGSRARFIDKKTPPLLGRHDNLVREIVGRERERGGDVVRDKAWVLVGDFDGRGAPRALAQHLLHGHPRAADHRLAAHHGGVDLDAGVLGHGGLLSTIPVVGQPLRSRTKVRNSWVYGCHFAASKPPLPGDG